jgi:methylmalonyl-CoA epimerase
MIKKIHHVGIAVRNLNEAMNFFEKTYGAETISRKVFPELKQESALIAMGECQFELAMSTDPEGVMAKFIEKRGEGIHHVSVEVDDLKNEIQHLEKQGLTVFGEKNVGEITVVYVHPKNNYGILVEIIAKNDEPGA